MRDLITVLHVLTAVTHGTRPPMLYVASFVAGALCDRRSRTGFAPGPFLSVETSARKFAPLVIRCWSIADTDSDVVSA